MDVRTSYLPLAEHFAGRDQETALVIALIEKHCSERIPTETDIKACRDAAKSILKGEKQPNLKSVSNITSGGPVCSSRMGQTTARTMNTNTRVYKAT